MTEPLLLLPDKMCDGRLFGPQIAALSSSATLQIARVSEGDTIEEMAASVLAVAPPRFALAGCGLGGMVAAELAWQVPDRVARLALIHTDPFAEEPSVAAEREPQIARVRAGQLDAVIRGEISPDELAAGPRRDEILNLLADMALRLGEEVYIRQSRALQRRPDQQARLRQLNVPALVLSGEMADPTALRRQELMAALIEDADLCVIPGAGCLPTLEQPQEVTAALAAWLLG